MIVFRPAAERGHARLDWLDSYHSFSFADYYDPRFMGVSNLRVINDDVIAPGGGFPMHGHQDMEIVTYVLYGSLAHRDSMGNGSVIVGGDVQYMSAGTGVRHSEFNASRSEPVRLLQIWLQPNRLGVQPRYAQRQWSVEEKRGRLALIVSPDGHEGSIATHQDGRVYASVLAPGERVELGLAAGRTAYVQMARGRADVNGIATNEGDGATLTGEKSVRIAATDETEILLFDLP